MSKSIYFSKLSQNHLSMYDTTVLLICKLSQNRSPNYCNPIMGTAVLRHSILSSFVKCCLKVYRENCIWVSFIPPSWCVSSFGWLFGIISLHFTKYYVVHVSNYISSVSCYYDVYGIRSGVHELVPQKKKDCFWYNKKMPGLIAPEIAIHFADIGELWIMSAW